MIRSLILLFKVGIVVLGIVLITSYPGSVVIDWEDYTLNTSTSVLALCIAGLVFLVYFSGNLYWYLRHFPSSIYRFFKIRTLASLESALKLTLEAYKAGDVQSLKKDLNRLSVLVEDPVLRSYFEGKVERLEGSRNTQKTFTELTNLRDGKLIGNRELADLAHEAGDLEKVFAYALKASEAYKKSPWALKILLAFYLLQEKYEEAEKALRQAELAKAFTQQKARQLQAGIWYKKALLTSDTKEQIRLLEKAVNWYPGLISAVLSLSMHYVNAQKFIPAQRIIEDAWQLTPYADLIPFYTASVKDPVEKARLVKALIKANPDHRVSLETLASSYLQAKLWGKAREILSQIPSHQLNIITCKLWAELELSEHKDTQKAQKWYDKMSTTYPAPRWTCSKCLTYFDTWQPVCNHCLALDQVNLLG